MTTAKAGLEALLTPESSVLVLIDHQPFQFANLHSHEPTMIVNNVIGLAKAAKSTQPQHQREPGDAACQTQSPDRSGRRLADDWAFQFHATGPGFERSSLLTRKNR